MNKYKIIKIAIVLLFGIFVGYNMRIVPHQTERVVIDTTFVDRPVPYRIDSLVKDTFIVTNVRYIKGDTIIKTDTVFLPIVQKCYKDTNYSAWVSGYNPSLDSIHIYQNNTYINTEIPIYRKWSFGLGPTANIGYGLFNENWDLNVGFGLSATYNF